MRPIERMTQFDRYIAVDFSANKSPKSGKDSIWWAEASWKNERPSVSAARNPRTRTQAATELHERLITAISDNESVLIGFDFPYGYPAGFSAKLGLEGLAWVALWKFLQTRIDDHQDSKWNNRFDVAAEINDRLGGNGPFWGCPESQRKPTLSTTKPFSTAGLSEFRHTETAGRGPKSTWQLFYNGSVGSQALLGIPRLATLRWDPALAPSSSVWPFETGASLPARETGKGRIIHAEIYPSLVPIRPEPGRVKDALQVEAQARFLAEEDSAGRLHLLFEAPARQLQTALVDVLAEEGWILGVR